ncbi:MAG: hypothetical protein QM652_01480 [Legionella sp.]|uniref:hypothetical protein n=1 Tax=Legionella sp. TaxID=459 RepID=UPI0039E29DDD
MLIRNYGIYLAYPPTVDLRYEGLGRHLTAFLKGAAQRKDVRFVIVCPCWSKVGLIELCISEKVPLESFDIITPTKYPLSLKCYELYQQYKQRPVKTSFFTRLKKQLSKLSLITITNLQYRLFVSRNILEFILLVSLFLLGSPFVLLSFLLFMTMKKGSHIIMQFSKKFSLGRATSKFKRMLISPKTNAEVLDLYQHIAQREISLMLKLINGMP